MGGNHRFAERGDAGVIGDAGEVEAPQDNGGTENPSTDADAEDADAELEASDDASDDGVDAGEDASEPPPPPPPPPPVDSGTDASDGSAPIVDAGTDADAGPCVDYVKAPESPTWAARAYYTLGPNTTQSVPYYCPGGSVEGAGCKGEMISRGAVLVNGSYHLYPLPGACRIVVPNQCLVCTGGKTEW